MLKWNFFSKKGHSKICPSPQTRRQVSTYGMSYYKITGMAIQRCVITNLQWENKNIWAKIDPPPPFRLVSDETVK